MSRHALTKKKEDVDGRDKPGHDGVILAFLEDVDARDKRGHDE